ncbi:L-threonine 3-dehydrogenase [compost metagenome]
MAMTMAANEGVATPAIPETMKAVIKPRPEPGGTLITTAVPTPGPREVLVKVKATTVCGTDVHLYTWDAWSQGRVKPPLIMGHELGGEVVAVGEQVKTAKIGDRVSAETHVVCGHCYQCRTGLAHVCANTTILGVDIPGCFAEYVVVPEENLWFNSPDLPMEWAPVQEPLGNAVHTVLAGDVAGRTVVVSGCGPTGILACAVAKAAGAGHVIAIDLNAYRLDLARQMGATLTIKADEEDAIARVLKEVPGGVDIVCEMSGNERAMNSAFKMIRAGGRYSILGLPGKPVTLDVGNDIVMRGVTVQGITGRKMMDTWYQVANLLNSRRIDLTPMITHHMSLDQIDEAMALMISGNCGKIVLTP